jgi:hypothetical protein
MVKNVCKLFFFEKWVLHIVALVIVYTTIGMEKKHDANQVTLKLFPSKVFSMKNGDLGQIHGLVEAVVEGLHFQKQQVFLKKSTQVGFVADGFVYQPEELAVALYNGVVNKYPIRFHKQLQYLDEKQWLEIVRYDDTGNKPVSVPIATSMKKRLLDYLLYDVSSFEYNCFHFCQHAFLDVNTSEKMFDVNTPFFDKMEVLQSETDIVAGDPLVLFERRLIFNKKTITLKHYVIALGDKLYISKCGSGGFIFVTLLKALLDGYECNGYARLKPEIFSYQSFLNNCLGSFEVQ